MSIQKRTIDFYRLFFFILVTTILLEGCGKNLWRFETVQFPSLWELEADDVAFSITIPPDVSIYEIEEEQETVDTLQKAEIYRDDNIIGEIRYNKVEALPEDIVATFRIVSGCEDEEWMQVMSNKNESEPIRKATNAEMFLLESEEGAYGLFAYNLELKTGWSIIINTGAFSKEEIEMLWGSFAVYPNDL